MGRVGEQEWGAFAVGRDVLFHQKSFVLNFDPSKKYRIKKSLASRKITCLHNKRTVYTTKLLCLTCEGVIKSFKSVSCRAPLKLEAMFLVKLDDQ